MQMTEKEKHLKALQNATRMNGTMSEDEERVENFIFGMIVAICLGLVMGWCATQYF